MINRRTILKSGAALAGAGMLSSIPTQIFAATSLQLGNFQIDVLSDGYLSIPRDLSYPSIDPSERDAFLSKRLAAIDALEPSCNLTLVRDGERNIIFDAGSGANFMPSAGKIMDALDAINVDPSDITHVVFTHAHPDHLWGVEDDFGDLLFYNAEHMISKPEFEFWNNENAIEKVSEDRQFFAVGAKNRLDLLEDTLSTFNFDDEIFSGIRAVNSVGHTPGHTSFEIKGGGQSLLITGDALTNAIISFEKPNWPSGSDQDKDQGAVTRMNLLDQITADDMMIVGYHLPYPGIGRVEKSGQSYKFSAA